MLTKNPFFILGITLRNNKEEITETFEQCAANEDYKESTLMHAQKNLLTSKARLEAEISWFPDLAPKKTQEIIDILQKTELTLRKNRKFRLNTVKLFGIEIN